MSLTSKQIDELRAYAKDRKGELAKLISDAADTIEVLSAKLHASQMERSSQYYHGGWIPVSNRLPDEGVAVLTQAKFKDDMKMAVSCRLDWNYWTGWGTRDVNIVAWRPLPEPYMGEGEK